MGKIMKATAALYSDSNFTTKVKDLGDVFIGIAVGSTVSVRLTEIKNNYAFFIDKISDGESTFLGGSYYANVDPLQNKVPSMWFPLCTLVIDTDYTDDKYLQYTFGNGYYMRTRNNLGRSGNTGWNFYNDVGTLIGTVFENPTALTLYYGSSSNDGRTRYQTLVVDSIDGNGNISGNGAFYQLNGFFGSDMWGQVDRISSASMTILSTFFNAIGGYVPTTDPYTQGGESGAGGGTGNFDGTSVDVDFVSLPTLSAVDTGFISLYNPTLAQLQSLGNYMWSNLFDLDTFKKLFADPMQAILGLSIVPGPVPSGAAQVVKVGNISTGVTMTKAATQYINIDCGTLNVEEFWGAYLDYEPYTKAEIYLPFIGVHQIAVDDIMNKPVHIMYHIDLLSGGCACEIKCGGSVLYTFIGSCAVSIPVTGSDWTNLINGVLSAASAIGTMVATGGATAPAAAGEIASAAVNSLKPSIEKSGSIAGAGGLLAGKVPVLILTRPRQALPGKQNTFTGYPAFITRSLGAISGYTEVHSIRLSGIDGTESEIDEIEELLKGGVIL